jgi:amidase
MPGFKEYDSYDALGLGELVRKGDVTASELVDEAIARIERVNPALNAVVTRLYDRARAHAKGADRHTGAFAGVPFAVKDLACAIGGVRLTWGSRLFSSYVAPHDSELARRYMAAGLNPVVRTTTPEFGIAPVTEAELQGPTSTPWKIGRTSGGSSGGSAALVGARAVPLAHASDGGGSIRIPASCCGIFGMKPTRGRTPMGPDMSEFWHGFAIEHAVSLSVRDSAALLDVSSGHEVGAYYGAPTPERPFLEETSRAPGKLRIALSLKPWLPASVHPDCVAAARDAAALCASLGHEVVEDDPVVDTALFAIEFLKLICADTAAGIALGEDTVGRKARLHDLEKTTWVLRYLGEETSGVELSRAKQELLAQGRRFQTWMADRGYDAVLTPTLGRPPVLHGALRPTGVEAMAQEVIVRGHAKLLVKLPGLIERIAKEAFEFVPFTPMANVTGQPSMNMPLHWNGEGLPIGTTFTGRFGDEATLFRLAAQLEQARPWRDRRPPVDAASSSAAAHSARPPAH